MIGMTLKYIYCSNIISKYFILLGYTTRLVGRYQHSGGACCCHLQSNRRGM